MEDQKNLPEEGDIVIANVKQVTNHGAYVFLEEYDAMTGFLHISEIATGWIRNIERYIRPNQKIVLKVIRVNKARSEVDLSLKQVSGEEKKSKIIEVKKNEKANAFMAIIKSKANLSNEQIKQIEEKILIKYDYIYNIFESKYRIVLAAENFKIAEKSINSSIEKIKSAIEKKNGNFNFIRQESKKTQQQLVH